MNKEIEVKIQTDEQIFNEMQNWLNSNAKFIKEIHHLEYYINNPTSTFFFTSTEGYKDALNYLRVRITKNGDYFCYKKFHEDPILKRPLYCDEYEVKISDGKKTLELMEALGFTEQSRMEKLRKIYQYKDFEIVVDDVKDLGKFIEIELKKDIDDPKKGLQIIYDFLKSIGISKIRLQKRGYISMLWNPDYNFTQEIVLNTNKETNSVDKNIKLQKLSYKEHFLQQLKKLKNLNLPHDQYIIWGSGVLAIRDIRKAKDIDIIVSKNYWNQLLQKHTPQGEKKNVIRIGNIEIWNDCMNLTDKIDQIISDKDIIEGYPFMKIKYSIEWKRFLNREKDIKDIELLTKLL